MRRVVITGMALASPLGCDINTAFNRLQTYKNCVEYIPESEEIKGLITRLGARTKDFIMPEHFTRKITRTMGPVSVMAVATAEQALKCAGLLNDNILTNGRTGIAYGSSTGSISSIMDFYSVEVNKEVKNINSGSYIKMMPQTTAVNISLYFKTTGRIIPTSTACTSGSLGIGTGYEAIKYGLQDVMITGGAEEFHTSQLAVFDTLYATSTKNNNPEITPAPFDKDRDGLVIGEGAGTLILEEYEHAKKRGAHIYAEIAGFATNTDGTHITNPNPETMKIVMENSLKEGQISSEKIGYVSAHGTGTTNGDIAETNATYNVFKRAVPISSLKSYTGHTLGACGAIEAIMAVKMMNENLYHPTLNLKNIDENCAKLDYIRNESRSINTEYVMSNNFAFGGINTSIILKKIN